LVFVFQVYDGPAPPHTADELAVHATISDCDMTIVGHEAQSVRAAQLSVTAGTEPAKQRAVAAAEHTDHEHEIASDPQLAWVVELQRPVALAADDATPRPVRDVDLMNGAGVAAAVASSVPPSRLTAMPLSVDRTPGVLVTRLTTPRKVLQRPSTRLWTTSN
jgi:hypothetical protein